MLSIERQCTEVTAILEALQACVDRQGDVIPCRAESFAVFVARGRSLMGVTSCAKEANAARDLYSQRRPS